MHRSQGSVERDQLINMAFHIACGRFDGTSGKVFPVNELNKKLNETQDLYSTGL